MCTLKIDMCPALQGSFTKGESERQSDVASNGSCTRSLATSLSLSVNGTIEILRTHRSDFAFTIAFALYEQAFRLHEIQLDGMRTKP